MSTTDVIAPMGLDQRVALLERLVREHPAALATAIDADGRWTAVPSSVGFDDHRPTDALSAISAIAPGSRPAVLVALQRASEHGAATLQVRLLNGVEAECHLIDVRHRHGVIVGVLLGASQIDVDMSLEREPPPPPRTGRIEKDAVAVLTDADASVCRMLGYDRSELIGRRSIDLIHLDDRALAIERWLQLLAEPGNTVRHRSRHLRRDGTWLWVEITNHHLVDDEGETRVVTEITDISQEVAALEHLRQREELLTRLTEALPSGVAHVDRQRNVLLTNAQLHRVLGIGAAATFAEQFATVRADDRRRLTDGLDRVLADGRAVDLEVRLDLAGTSGQHRASIAIRVLTDDREQPAGAVLAVDDVTDASALRTELERRATIDELTGCLNRSAVLDLLDHRLAEHRSAALGTTVSFLDLDDFKEVNDTHGHHAGDLVLAAAATRVRSVLRTGDALGRMGGDEFVVVSSGVASFADASQIAHRIVGVFAEPFEVPGGARLVMSVSVGAAWSGRSGVDAQHLTAEADRAMYRSKRAPDRGPVVTQV